MHIRRTKTLAEVEKWLKTLPSHNQKPVNCGSSILDDPVVEQIQEAVEKMKVRNVTVAYRRLKDESLSLNLFVCCCLAAACSYTFIRCIHLLLGRKA